MENVSTLSESVEISNVLQDPSLFPIKLPADSAATDTSSGVLEAQLTTLVPVCFRAGKAGNHTYRFLFLYQSQVIMHLTTAFPAEYLQDT
jgi:hypothetical protein